MWKEVKMLIVSRQFLFPSLTFSVCAASMVDLSNAEYTNYYLGFTVWFIMQPGVICGNLCTEKMTIYELLMHSFISFIQ